MPVESLPIPPNHPVLPAGPRLGSVCELESPSFRKVMEECNAFAARHGLRQFTNWTKVWEYPWIYLHGLGNTDWHGKHLVDFGSEISPMPWWLATRGARVTLIEADQQWAPQWEKVRANLGVDVDWRFVTGEDLPLPTASADVVTSFSVIEHQYDKSHAVAEIARVLKPGAPFYLSFDICEPELGMTFPDWNGRALTMAEFEREIWQNPLFVAAEKPTWNVEDVDAYKAWHLQSAPHHNYITGAAVLVRR